MGSLANSRGSDDTAPEASSYSPTFPPALVHSLWVMALKPCPLQAPIPLQA